MVKFELRNGVPDSWKEEIDPLISDATIKILDIFGEVHYKAKKITNADFDNTMSILISVLSRVDCNVLDMMSSNIVTTKEINKFLDDYLNTIKIVVMEGVKKNIFKD